MMRHIAFMAFFFVGTCGLAQTQIEALSGAPAVKVTKVSRSENLLDFEAEVIEGEKKRPELFLDIKAGDGNVGSGLYLRPHFDDFFIVDKKRRPKFIKAK